MLPLAQLEKVDMHWLSYQTAGASLRPLLVDDGKLHISSLSKFAAPSPNIALLTDVMHPPNSFPLRFRAMWYCDYMYLLTFFVRPRQCARYLK